MNQIEQYLDNKDLHSKWAFLTEGLSEDRMRKVTCLLENQARFGGIHNGDQRPGGSQVATLAGGLDAVLEHCKKPVHEAYAGVSTDIATFLKIAFPLVRQIWGTSVLLDLVSVQPMVLPVQKLFSIDYKAGSAGATLIGAGDSFFDRAKNPDPSYVLGIAENAAPRDAYVEITATEVSAIIMKLRANWSFETEHNIDVYHGLNLESELNFAMANIIRRDVEKWVLDGIIADVATNIAILGVGVSPFDVTITDVAVTSDDTFRARQAAVLAGVTAAKQAVYASVFRHPNRWVVGSKTMAILEGMDDYIPSSNVTNTADRQLVGSFKGLSIYRDPYMGADVGYMWYQGTGMAETAYIFGPHIPLMVTPKFFNPETFSNVKGVLTSNGRKMVNADMFVKVTIA